MNISMLMSVLKIQYGWCGVLSKGKDDGFNEIIKKHTCINCAVIELAAFIHDECGEDYFSERLDGKPNHRSVASDRQIGGI